MTANQPAPTVETFKTFEELERISLTDLLETQWDAYYAHLLPWLQSGDANIRKRAIHRLYTAVFSAEPHTRRASLKTGATGDDAQQTRIVWYLATVDAAHAAHSDVIPLTLEHLRFASSYNAEDPLAKWLERLRADPPPSVDAGMVQGIQLMNQAFDEDDAVDVARMVALLDHPSNYLRACAALVMSARSGAALNPLDMFALIKQKEIIRPGVAGPYWSEWWSCDDVPVDPIAWMMDILERRSGPEPADMPTNGIDFALHEICSGSPEAVQRMINGAYFELASQTACETLGVVEGMAPCLAQLASNPDVNIRQRTQFHLAHYYRLLHPEAAQRGAIRRWLDWSPDADVFSFYYGEQRALWFVTIYPREQDSDGGGDGIGGHFNDALAWRLIDQAMPPALRGEVQAHPLQFDKTAPPGPYALGNNEMWRFAEAVNIELHGNPSAKTWTRLDISGAKLGARWQPFSQP